MAASLHTLSSSHDDSDDSLPDLETRLKPLLVQPLHTKPTFYTLSSDGESDFNEENKKGIENDEPLVINTKLKRTTNSVVPDDFEEELPVIHEFTFLTSSSRVTTDGNVDTREENFFCHPQKKFRSEIVREQKKDNRKQREAAKQRRAVEKAEAKAQRDAEKAYKHAMKPGECIKHVIVQLDRQLLELAEGSQVISQLQTGGIRYRIVDSAVAAAATIVRVDPVTRQETPAEEAVVIMAVNDFVEVVKKQVYEDGVEGLCHQSRKWKRSFNNANLTLVVCGVEVYLRNKKTHSQQNFRSAVLGGTTKPMRGRKQKSGGEFHNSTATCVSRVDIETALVTAQLECGLNHRLMADASGVATFILQITKAVAEAPFKHEKGEPSFSWYAEGSSINAVKIDKSGVGLLKLWHQQLRQFNNVGVEVAQAIASKYPSPCALLQSYRKCLMPQEASLLLADIPVRRGAGPLTSSRRVGPELSKKIHLFLTTKDSEVSLGQTT
ncbi:crossover junction endonuclease EME1-like [Homarus americanus]|uniref:crossover junction endonuclease EME1-like n=1 Tax=Homarus americanus TaxID=6706 RepID=UPI001C441F9E|nr:crossover junction endonuclease EME1-like [Homarus americanus]XP_042204275.1 crossover junction endonuclease EME1-like [Homarus americanus]XP_042204280.1 crossover junction endonuclease EME1-like [Homarus americanus]